MVAKSERGKVAHWIDGDKTLCGLSVDDSWQVLGTQSEKFFLNTAKGACARCQGQLRKEQQTAV
jgi:hypothetical protein